MQRGDKAPEQSMEEILASIRKIIAEEPIGSRPAPTSGSEEKRDAPPPGGPGDPFASFSAGGASPTSAYGRAGTAGSPVKGEPRPFLPSADQEMEAEGKVPALDARPVPAEPRRPSWLFSKPTGIPPPPMEHPAAPARTIEPLPSAFETLRPGTQGDGGKLSFPPSPLLKTPVKGEQGLAATFQDETAVSGLPDLTSLEQGEEREVGAEHGSAPGSDFSAETAAPALAADPGAKAGAAPAAAAPALQRGVGGSEGKPAASASASSAAPGQLAAAPEASASPAAGLAARVAAGPEMGPSSPLRQRDAGAATDDHSPGIPTSGVQAPAGQVSSAPAEAQRLDDAKPRTLEDTVAELLRPMVRDWLDANMPRIVEKALKVELGASKDRKPGAK